MASIALVFFWALCFEFLGDYEFARDSFIFVDVSIHHFFAWCGCAHARVHIIVSHRGARAYLSDCAGTCAEIVSFLGNEK